MPRKEPQPQPRERERAGLQQPQLGEQPARLPQDRHARPRGRVCQDRTASLHAPSLVVLLMTDDALLRSLLALWPHSPQQTRICNGAGLLEDPQGSKKIPSTGINPVHLSVRRFLFLVEMTVETVFWDFYMTPYLIGVIQEYLWVMLLCGALIVGDAVSRYFIRDVM
ncbi:hypothetical protein C8R44DRAFT_438895 [Mycena epipterygia]|nr:hypothetical protein C8R44DRAFT_438895 [Mycena epipterygia]